MPPQGLYQMPRHHAFGQARSSVRHVFNSMDFDKQTPEPVVNTTAHEKSSEKKDKDKRKKKKHSLDAKGDKPKVKASSAPATPAVIATPIATSSKSKKSKDSKSERDVGALGTSTQKRKRQSTVAPTTNGNGRNHADFLDGARFLEGLKSSMGNLGASFGSSPSIVKSADRPSKKQKKASRKSEGDPATVQATKPTHHVAGETASKKIEKKKDNVRSNLNAPSRAKTSVPVLTDNSPVKTPVPLPIARPRQASTPQQTPIPLPQKSPFESTVSVAATSLKQDKAARAKSQILVTETPPSQVSRSTATIDKTPIPFKLPQATLTPICRRKTKKGPTIDISPPGSSDVLHMPSSMPSNSSQAVDDISSGKSLLTFSNLGQYKQALSDKPKPKPRGPSSSIAASTVSSDSNRSIKDMFARVNKPYTRSGAEIDPFVAPPVKKKNKNKNNPHETHDEADLQTFTAAYSTTQKTVNFTDEQEYQTAYMAFKTKNTSAGPLPCLNKATGCNPKREQVLRLSKEDPSPMLTVTIATTADTAQLAHATTACLDAERLLTLAVAARVPVPLGRIHGVWKLFCPSYSDAHVDIYGFGQRTLSISRVAGCTSPSLYMARLSLPPRSMAFTVLGFEAPPHASFRGTTLRTGVEGYRFEVVFLGNGYLKAWIDLQELLMGKRMEGKGGKEMKMEFWGVREGAVAWVEEVDDLEVEGKRLCRAYDGE